MRRFIALFSIALVAVAALTSLAQDRIKIKSKVAVCHQPEEVDSLGVLVPAHVIIIGAPAVDAHLRNHLDCVLAPSDTLKAGEPCDCATVPQ